MSKIISKDEALDFEAWDIPLVEAGAGVQTGSGAGLKKYLNAKQLEDIYQQAFQEAWKQGQQQGLQAGQQSIRTPPSQEGNATKKHPHDLQSAKRRST